MTLHGLRGTVITQLFESGHAESSVALRSGHRGMEAMKAYQYLRGRLGMKQQEDILDGKYGKIGQEKRRKMNSYNSITTENKENSIPIVSLPVESAGFGMTRSRKEIEFLTGVGTVSGLITINLNYYRDKGEERDVEGDDEEVSKVLR